MSAEKIAKKMIDEPTRSSQIFQDYVMAAKSVSARRSRFRKVQDELAKKGFEYVGLPRLTASAHRTMRVRSGQLLQWESFSDVASGEAKFGEDVEYPLEWQGLPVRPELWIATASFDEAIDQQHEFASLEDAFDSYGENVLETAVEEKLDPYVAGDFYGELLRRHEKTENNPRPPEEFYFDVGPNEPVDLTVWRQEVLDDTAAARADPQLRLLLGARTLQLLDRLATAPTRKKYFERVRAGIHIEPVEVEGADEGWYLDEISGRWVVQEDDGTWYREVEHPPGAFTLGEMAELEARLWGAGEALAQAAEAGLLDQAQREAAVGVVEAADNLQMRLTIKKWHPDEATRREAKRTALEILAGRDPDLKRMKRKLLR